MKKFPHHCFEIPPPPPTTAMPALKLSMSAASFSSKPYKWPRSFLLSPSSPSSSSSTTSAVAVHLRHPSPLSSAAAPEPVHCSISVDSGSSRAWRRIPACAHRAPFNDYRYQFFSCSSNNKSKNKISLLLGLPSSLFPGASSRRVSISSSTFSSSRGNSCGSSSSAPKASGFSGSDPSASSGVIAEEDMGSDNKVVDGVNGFVQPSSSPDHPKQHYSTKILTLPTILTLGRVAAVPLLIATFYVDSWFGRTATTSIFIAAAITDWLDGYLARKMKLGSAFGAFLDPVADKLMVAATLVILCTKPLEVPMLGPVSWLLTVPSIAIIGREVTTHIMALLSKTVIVCFGYLYWLEEIGSCCDVFYILATKFCSVFVPSPLLYLFPYSEIMNMIVDGKAVTLITMSAVREWAASQDSKLLEAVAVNNLGKWKTATQMIALTILLATRDGGVGGPGVLVASGVVLLYISAGLSVFSLAVYMSKIWKVLLK
ncbi:CDP-diacylglycerol--glycerol-3-phosphate 3-phosphatidyltransferase 1, chloroplastic [Linum perenne]